MFIPLDPKIGLMEQIYEVLRQRIENGELPAGFRLPSTRGFAEQLGVSRNTILGAFDRLVSEGYIESVQRKGMIVSAIGVGPNPNGLKKADRFQRDSQRPSEELMPQPEGARRQPTLPSPHQKQQDIGPLYSRLDGPESLSIGRVREAEENELGTSTDSSSDPPRPLSMYAQHLKRAPTVYSPYSWPLDRSIRFDFRHNVTAADSQSDRAWAALQRQVLREPTPGGYVPSEMGGLRDELLAYLSRVRGIHCDPRQLILVSGPQAAFHTIIQTTLDPGDAIALEEAHYLGVRSSALAVGAHPVPIPIDDRGIRTDALDQISQDTKLAYVVPSHQWPTGAILPYGRRLALLQWASRRNIYVIENDHNVEYRERGKPLEALQTLDTSDRVFYVGSLLRLRVQGLRIGFVVVPLHFVETFRAAHDLAGAHPSPDEQRVLAYFIKEGHLDRIHRRVRHAANQRREAMVRSLRDHFSELGKWTVPRGGFHIHMKLQDTTEKDIDPLVKRALRAGIRIYPDAPFFLRPPKSPGVLLGFGKLTPDEIESGVKQLARIVSTRS